jgi:periplasmic divalent cation tolerance protein
LNNSGRAALVWSPFPDRETAKSIIRILLEERLIACANLFPDIESMFLWDGDISAAHETGVLFKTTADRIAALVARLGELHPYDTPVIIGWQCESAHPATLEWLGTALNEN